MEAAIERQMKSTFKGINGMHSILMTCTPSMTCTAYQYHAQYANGIYSISMTCTASMVCFLYKTACSGPSEGSEDGGIVDVQCDPSNTVTVIIADNCPCKQVVAVA